MSKQVLLAEQMQHPQELGLELKRTLLYYFSNEQLTDNQWDLYYPEEGSTIKDDQYYKFLPAYTLQDVLDVLPKFIHDTYDRYLNLAIDSEKLWCASYDNYDIGSTLKYINDESPIDVAYELIEAARDITFQVSSTWIPVKADRKEIESVTLTDNLEVEIKAKEK